MPDKIENTNSLVLNPKFIPMYPWMLWAYSYLECIVYGFIDFFLANNNQFFCTDEQLAEMLKTSPKTISRSISNLKKWWLIETETKWKQKWWTYRIIKLVKAEWTKMSECESRMDKNVWVWKNVVENKENDENEISQSDKNVHQYINNIISYDIIFSNYYWKRRWINEWKCKKLIDWLIKQWITFDEINKCMTLYNCECSLKQDFTYVKKLETWLDDFQQLDEDQIDDWIHDIARNYKSKLNTHPKFANSKPAKSIWESLVKTFGEDKIKWIWRSEWKNSITLNLS